MSVAAGDCAMNLANKDSALREAERRAITTLADLTNSLVLAHYFGDIRDAYDRFVVELAAQESNAKNTASALAADIKTLEAVLLVLRTLKARIATDVDGTKATPN